MYYMDFQSKEYHGIIMVMHKNDKWYVIYTIHTMVLYDCTNIQLYLHGHKASKHIIVSPKNMVMYTIVLYDCISILSDIYMALQSW